ncbi:hypothetical protein [Motiliproteus sp. SC1-56]|uniref:hypothetical protein n=1 Tax=Motiliproteus sp. SC1-56 TaxID=2799565 RepID=UPI001A8FCD6E|nr:hypothetical protein [Motiliproteus sp. SC1-56]
MATNHPGPTHRFATGPARAWMTFLAHGLFILAAWTLFIKYLFPIAMALAAGKPLHTHIYWDFWPVVHVWLGWALLARPAYARTLALVVALTEVVIVLTLLTGFLAEPQWSIWRTNWFVNKVFVLACFSALLITLLVGADDLKRGERPS